MGPETMLATSTDAQLVLKLYELRAEPDLRAARKWVIADFWPESAGEILTILRSFGVSQANSHLRQVEGYWEMAAALVLHGALDADLFFDCNQENLFILNKFVPFLKEIREEFPDFLIHTGELVERFTVARKLFERIGQRNSSSSVKPSQS